MIIFSFKPGKTVSSSDEGKIVKRGTVGRFKIIDRFSEDNEVSTWRQLIESCLLATVSDFFNFFFCLVKIKKRVNILWETCNSNGKDFNLGRYHNEK